MTIIEKILAIMGLADFDQSEFRRSKKRFDAIKKQMIQLSADFAKSTRSEDQYPDAYFIYNFPMNFMKTALVVEETEKCYPDIFRHQNHFRVLDIGCGQGAGMFGLYYALSDSLMSSQFHLTGVDQSSQMLETCKVLAEWFRQGRSNLEVKLDRKKVILSGHPDNTKKYDVILFINSLAEIFFHDDIPVKFIEKYLNQLTDTGIMIIIEPALKRCTRRLMALRNKIAKSLKAHTLLPCLNVISCPLLEIEGEWCHESVTWQPPDFMKYLNQGLNREVDCLKYSYLVIASKEHASTMNNGQRVVSCLLTEKGKKRCFLCTPHGRIELTRLNKDKSLNNSAFDSITKGAIIKIKDCNQRQPRFWRIEKNTAIQVLPTK